MKGVRAMATGTKTSTINKPKVKKADIRKTTVTVGERQVEVGLSEDARGAVFAAPTSLPGMGANLNDKGCTFRVWAPFAEEVYVAGNFTTPQWDPGKVRL